MGNGNGENCSMKIHQDDFDNTIGKLDRTLSKLVLWGKQSDADLDLPNRQTLKHHAEDMIAAGQKILKDLGSAIEGTPQTPEEAVRDLIEKLAKPQRGDDD